MTGRLVGGESAEGRQGLTNGHHSFSMSFQEDDKVVELVKKHGCKKWSLIAKHLQGRLGKQCRERWYNHLNPDIKKEAWSKAEDDLIIDLHSRMGNRWAEIAKFVEGRWADDGGAG